jgi:hypothetical protein
MWQYSNLELNDQATDDFNNESGCLFIVQLEWNNLYFKWNVYIQHNER